MLRIWCTGINRKNNNEKSNKIFISNLRVLFNPNDDLMAILLSIEVALWIGIVYPIIKVWNFQLPQFFRRKTTVIHVVWDVNMSVRSMMLDQGIDTTHPMTPKSSCSGCRVCIIRSYENRNINSQSLLKSKFK